NSTPASAHRPSAIRCSPVSAFSQLSQETRSTHEGSASPQAGAGNAATLGAAGAVGAGSAAGAGAGVGFGLGRAIVKRRWLARESACIKAVPARADVKVISPS